MACTTKKLTASIVDDRSKAAVKGLADCKLVLINKVDITDYTEDVANHMIITDIEMTLATSGFEVPNIKSMNDTSSEFVPKDDDVDGHKHVLNLQIRKLSAENLKQLSDLEKNDEGVVAVVHYKYKGVDNLDAFQVLGVDAGLKVTVSTGNSKEYAKVTLSTKDDALEIERPRILRLGAYSVTLAAFDNNMPA